MRDANASGPWRADEHHRASKPVPKGKQGSWRDCASEHVVSQNQEANDMHAQGEPNTTDFRVFIKDKSALRNCSVSPHTSTCRWHHRVALARYPPQG